MSFEYIIEKLKQKNNIEQKIGFNPYYKIIESSLDERIIIEGKSYINLASNNYLGLANDIEIKSAIIEAVNKYGASLCGTPVATGYVDLLNRVEQKLAKFVGLESAIILPTCYQANNGLFLSIATKEDIIIVDRFAHSSLVQGIMAVGCKYRPFLHNNLEHLKGILEKSTNYKQIFVVTESVFSTEGSIAPLKEMSELCEKYNTILIVDDSHGIGVIGKSGRGILEESGVENFKGIYTASLGKAISNLGGVIAGDKNVIEYLRYYCPHLVYSTALPPSVLGGIEKTLEIIENKFDTISKKMWKYKEMIYMGLIEAGFEVSNGKAPINSILSGSAENTILIARKFFESNILVTPFVEPSVPINEGKVRIIAGANLSEDSIEIAINKFKEIAKLWNAF